MAKKQTKPLMIRGDRLLLALDVLDAWWQKDCVIKDPLPDTRFSVRRTAKVLKRFGFNLTRDFLSIPEWRFMQVLLRTGSGIEQVDLNGELLLNYFDQTYTPDGARDRHRKFFSAIASGKLTRADFFRR